MTGWDFAVGGEAAPRVRPDLAGLPGAVEAALEAPAARGCAVGALVALRGVAVRWGLGWRVEVRGAAVAVAGVEGKRRREVVLVWRGGWTVKGGAGVRLAALG
jgi:hypothetical protein